MEEVDKLFEAKVKELGDWRGECLVELRKLVEVAAPEAEMTWKWGSPVWVQNGLLLSLGSFADHVKVHFFRGALISDDNGLFNAGMSAKLTRGIDLYKDSGFDEEALAVLIKEAVEVNTKG